MEVIPKIKTSFQTFKLQYEPLDALKTSKHNDKNDREKFVLNEDAENVLINHPRICVYNRKRKELYYKLYLNLMLYSDLERS